MFASILKSVLTEQSIAPFVDKFNSFVAYLGDFYPIAIITICFIIGLFGRRLSGLIRVCLLFAVGFVASVHWLAPIVVKIVPGVPAILVGIAVGIFAAVMSRMIYDFVYIGCIGFDTYNICFNALFLVEITAMTKGNIPLCVGIAAVAVVLALLIRKYLEMLLTAGVAGIGIAYYLKQLVDYTVHVNLQPNTTVIILGAILAVPLFIYQYYHRVIY